ncbi:MAG: TolC family protein [Gemmatimonadetes bacterium]|nr:TolC family protein [Gemmatimonadota bacterium]
MSQSLKISALLLASLAAGFASGLRAQTHIDGVSTAPGSTTAETLDGLTARAVAVHPSVLLASARVEAARARVGPAGAWMDPMVMAGVQNLPVSEPGFKDFMTMKMVGIAQTVPYPGKTRLRRSAAELEVLAPEARLDAARLEAVQRVREAYYELAYIDQALEITARNQLLLSDFIRISEVRYSVGSGGQQDVLKAGVEAARLAEETVALTEQRRIAQARLNEAVDRYSETPIAGAAVPDRIARAAVALAPAEIRFVSASFGARAAGSPLPALRSLEEMAVANSPLLREQQTMIDAQTARLELAGRAHLPDFDLSLQYGQRSGYTDMVSATVSIPLPVNRRGRQNAEVSAVRAELLAADAGRHEVRNRVRLDVARLHSELERDRAQLALYVKSILPQARASLESATAGYQVGRVDLLALLDDQTTLYNYEAAYHRLLSDFARKLAEV